jgi:uncharacterized membrane protein
MRPTGSMALLAIRLGALVGIVATSYALYVEHKLEAAKKTGDAYEALCDIRHGDVTVASCSAVFSSSYARVLSHWGLVAPGSALDVSNAALGLAFYVAALLHDQLGVPHHALVLLAASLGSLAFSAYLAYVLNVVIVSGCCCGGGGGREGGRRLQVVSTRRWLAHPSTLWSPRGTTL